MISEVRPTRVRAPEAKRTSLLHAAAMLFVRDGYEATTVTGITETAGVAKGTFYLYFESKENLLEALRVGFGEQIATRLTELKPPSSKNAWKDYIGALVRLAIDLYIEGRHLHEVVMHGPHPAPSPHAGHGHNPIRLLLRDMIQTGLEQGVFKGIDVDRSTDLVYDLLHALGDRVCHSPTDADAIADNATLMLWRALTGKPS
jgi:AcrR family transcriptional regulator